ncbi:adenylate cyclase [Sporothrix schenckii 1099-18]|uniref:Adenylate cyclase n=1 Tax=Sporothrix schenckii 1099-18 TaxID=1397361 RepID=A0A0F2M812_SPOSC|nr:adenylate cyclase [Sporothrix schenckii 1099-18]KJR85782.1 adenylate cyclase [Sporothrix schenckii 1099-18]
MTRNEAASRMSSVTSASTDSGRSSVTVKPLPSTPIPTASPSLRGASPSPEDGRGLRHTASVDSRRGPPSRLRTDDNANLRNRTVIRQDSQISPTSTAATVGTTRGTAPPLSSTGSNNINMHTGRDHRDQHPHQHQHRADFGNYRRDLAVLDADTRSGSGGGDNSSHHGGRTSSAPQIPQLASLGSPGLSQIAPWMSAGGSSSNNNDGHAANAAATPGTAAGGGGGGGGGGGLASTSFYNDSSENVSIASQLSPAFRTNSLSLTRHHSAQTPASTSNESPDAAFFNDDRRPSVASIATSASSTGSKASDRRGGGFRKLQGFFGEEFPGRDNSDASISTTGKETRSQSYSHGRPHRDRNLSNATDRDPSPSSSRPRTPVPAPEVVPFLYQEADDIARYGEAPVRDTLSGPDRDRYVNEASGQNPPKTSSSSRSGHSLPHLPHHHHRHNKSNDDPRTILHTISREDSIASMRERATPAMYTSTRSRAQSPTPSGNSGSGSASFSAPKTSFTDGQISPPGGHPKKGLLGRLRRHKDKDDGASSGGNNSNNGGGSHTAHSIAAQLKKVPHNAHNLSSRPSRHDVSRAELGGHFFGSDMSLSQRFHGDYEGAAQQARHGSTSRQATFNNKFPFSKKNRTHRHIDDQEEMIGPTDRADNGTQFFLDTDLNNMDGILSRPLPLTPMDADAHRGAESDRGTGTPRINHYFQKHIPHFGTHHNSPAASTAAIAGPGIAPSGASGPNGSNGPNGAWNAPDSWAVRRTGDDVAAHHLPETDDFGSPPRNPEEKVQNYCIRVFKSDGTFATLQMPLTASVQDVVAQLAKRVFTESQNFQIVLKRHGIIRILSPAERPLMIQKRLLQQVGYEQRDHIEDIGREDNSYLCRFLFVSAHESDFQSRSHDLGFSRMPKLNHVDLSSRNLITIPITLYSKAADITSLNLSRNLSLDVPRDFIQSCLNLRDIKYSNNEARKIPHSLGRASRLTFLDVSNNRIETMEHAELEDITGVLKLNLANNRLKQLPSYFCAYHALRTLNISSNFLDKFPGFVCELESLVDLDLSFNLISSLPDAIGNLRNLEKFVITNNRLSGAFPLGFQDLQSLRELDIKYNTITSIDIISELPKLEILTADHNAISQFVGSFERLRSLKLNANPITRFEIVNPLPTLKLLNLSNAQLASIDDSFNNMRNLESLHLDKNYFVSLPNQIGNLGRLETFSIANNSVGELPPEIGCLTELRVLDVRGNNIRKLPMEIWWANKLETLNASSNVLENFPKPASRAPQVPGESNKDNVSSAQGRMMSTVGTLSSTPSSEELSADGSRRPSQASSTLLSVGPSPVPSGPDRKSSVVSVYGKGGRKTSIVSRSTAQSSGMATPTASSRKDSGLSSRITNTFAGSLRNLYLADNQLDDEVFEQLALLGEIRVLNVSYNDLTDIPQRSMTSWPQLVELYLSGNELTTLPADDLGEYSMLQVLHINGNKFTNLPADISRAKKLAVLDCGNNSLKYNISNVPYDWNWNLNRNLRYLNLSGNRRLEIKQTAYNASAAMRSAEQYADFNRLPKLRVLGLMDVTLTQPSVPDQTEDSRVRTSGSMAGFLPYGMADTLGKNEHLSTIDLVVPRFSSNANEGNEQDTLLCLFDGQALSSGGSKIAKFLHENFSRIFAAELKALKANQGVTIEDCLRRAFLTLNKDLVTSSIQAEDRLPLSSSSPAVAHRGSIAPMVLTKEDLNSGGVATVVYLLGQELYVANVGDAQAMLIQSDGSHKVLTRKHDPAEPNERSRIRDAGGWVSRNGRLNDVLDVSRAFGYSELMPSVMAAPHVVNHKVREQDETVVLATKELWEYLSPGLVVDIARQERGDLMRASQKLRDLAMAYGASGKIMVMMLSLSDLKRKTERSRLHRGQSMSLYPSGVPEEAAQQFLPTRRGKRTKGDVLDSTLQRLDAEVPAPTGLIAIVFTDIKSSTTLWEIYPAAMRSAIKLHNDVMRRQLRYIGGFEVKTEGDAFMVSFPTATSALLWAFAVQLQLLDAPWPTEMLNSVTCQPILDKDSNIIFRGLSVRMGIHWGEPLCEPDPITRRMDYYGPMVNKAARINSIADGGQITVSSDFISEIQRCLETYQESPTGSGGAGGSSEDGVGRGSVSGNGSVSAAGGSVGGSSTAGTGFDDDTFAQTIRKELKALSSQGFAVKELGEIKLKGLENPEVVYSLYPHALAGRMEAHSHHERLAAAVAAAASGVEGAAVNGSGSGSYHNNSTAGATAAAAAAAVATAGSASSSDANTIPAGGRAFPGSKLPAPTSAIILGDPDTDDLRMIPEVIWGLWRVSLRLEMLCSSLEQVDGSGLQPPETELLERMKQRGANVTERFLLNFLAHQISRIETCINTLTVRHMAMGAYKAKYGPLQGGHIEDEMEDEDDEDDEGSDTEQE